MDCKETFFPHYVDIFAESSKYFLNDFSCTYNISIFCISRYSQLNHCSWRIQDIDEDNATLIFGDCDGVYARQWHGFVHYEYQWTQNQSCMQGSSEKTLEIYFDRFVIVSLEIINV